ncbi:MAG: fused MFS/spermidine synthase [Pseudomonadota bacterium]
MRFSITIALILVLSAVGLTYEIAAGRVLAPFFGTSLLTWTTVIAIVLAGFSLGSALGGLIAENPRDVALGQVRWALVASAALMAVSPAFLGVVHALGARGTAGMVISVFLVFFPASVFITMPSPFLAKLAIEARPGREGSSLGFVLAAGSIGAIFGAIIAGFVALPLIGSTATFAACGVVALLCLPFLRGARDQKPSDEAGGPNTVVTLAAAGFVGFAGLAGTPVCQFESGLSCLHVVQRDGTVRLYSDGTTQAAETLSPSNTDGALTLAYTRWIWQRIDRDLPKASAVLFVGGGGYSLPTQLLAADPDATAVAVEIDPLVTDVVRQNLPRAAVMIQQVGYEAPDAPLGSGRLGIVHADGRIFINETTARFDAAVMDAFSSGSVPAHLATLETYQRLKTITDGPVYINLIDQPDGRLVRGVHAILAELYPHIIAISGPTGREGRANQLLAASDTPLAPLSGLPEGYFRFEVSEGQVFTDDRGWVGHR